VHPQRQTKPYAHWMKVDSTNRFALVADLGLDLVLVYRFDAAIGTLAPNDPPFAQTAPGAGPRQLVWHPNLRWIYAINELANTVTGYTWDGTRGTLASFQSESSLPSGFSGTSSASEIAVHPNGEFLYASNRGHNSIAVFAIDENSGQLTPRGHVDSRGQTPRYFVFDLTQRWMIVTHHDSDNIVVFAVDAATGALTPHGEPVSWVKPYAIVLLPGL
jgi:6-phosphogluconolactonase